MRYAVIASLSCLGLVWLGAACGGEAKAPPSAAAKAEPTPTKAEPTPTKPEPKPEPTPEPTPTKPASVEPTLAEPAPAKPGSFAWLGGVLDPSQTRTYAWTFMVDVHDEEGSVAEAKGTLQCRSSAPERRALEGGRVARVACQACEVTMDAADLDVEPALDECFVVTDDGLWIVEEAPRSTAELVVLLAEEPYLPATPVVRESKRTTVDDGFEIELGQSITSSEGGWCRTDSSTRMYGSETTRCFGPGPGLVSVSMDGRSGPSQEEYRLVSTTPPAG